MEFRIWKALTYQQGTTTRFPKARYAVNNNMSIVHIFCILSENNIITKVNSQLAIFVQFTSVEHHWF